MPLRGALWCNSGSKTTASHPLSEANLEQKRMANKRLDKATCLKVNYTSGTSSFWFAFCLKKLWWRCSVPGVEQSRRQQGWCCLWGGIQCWTERQAHQRAEQLPHSMDWMSGFDMFRHFACMVLYGRIEPALRQEKKPDEIERLWQRFHQCGAWGTRILKQMFIEFHRFPADHGWPLCPEHRKCVKVGG